MLFNNKKNSCNSPFFCNQVNCELCCHTVSYRFSKAALPGYCKFCVCDDKVITGKGFSTTTTSVPRIKTTTNNRSKGRKSTTLSTPSSVTDRHEKTTSPGTVIQTTKTTETSPTSTTIAVEYGSTPVQIITHATDSYSKKPESSSTTSSPPEGVSASDASQEDNNTQNPEEKEQSKDERSSSRTRRSTGNVFSYLHFFTN